MEISLQASPSRRWPDTGKFPRRYALMPPSMLVNKYKVYIDQVKWDDFVSKGYRVEGYLTHGHVIVDINHDLLRSLLNTWRINEPNEYNDYISFPPRFAMGSSANVECDRQLKIMKWVKYAEALSRVLPEIDSSLGSDLCKYWVEETRKCMSMGEHVDRYVKDHFFSHPVRGITWTEIKDGGMLPDLWDFTREVVEKWDDDFYLKGNWSLGSNVINYGSRARSPDIEFDSYVNFILTRSRQIGYCPGPSSCNAFVPHHNQVNIMKHIFSEFEQKTGVKIYCPKIDGGKIYTELRDAVLMGKKVMNFDVSGMEIITPSMLNGSMTNFPFGLGMVIGYMGPIPELLSGVGPTSDWDMIAHLLLLLRLFKRMPEFIVILGDDCTIVGGELYNSILYERQLKDERIHRTLGLTTGKYIHPVGLNLTIDNASKRIDYYPDQWIKNKLNDTERERIVEYFTGFVNGVPLHEILPKIPAAENVYSPREMIEYSLQIEATA